MSSWYREKNGTKRPVYLCSSTHPQNTGAQFIVNQLTRIFPFPKIHPSHFYKHPFFTTYTLPSNPAYSIQQLATNKHLPVFVNSR